MEQQETTAPEPSFRETVEQAEQPQEQAAAVENEQPEAQEGEQEQPEAQEKVEKVVPLAALHEERRRRQELQRSHEQSQAYLQSLQQQQVALMQELQRREQAAARPPTDPNADPLGYMAEGVQRTQAELNAMRQEMWQQQQRTAQEQARTAFIATVAQAEAAHVARVPDSRDAVQFLRERKYREYTAAGLDEMSASQAVDRDGWMLAQACLQRGENPQERAYEMALALGYKPRANAQDRVAMQAAGQKASTPAGGAGQGGGRISLDALAKMAPDEFLKATAGDKWKKLMGG